MNSESSSLKAISTESVVDQIISAISEAVISGKYPAGSKLPNEYELMGQLGVSRNSLREAIKILSATGVLEIRRGDGTYVCTTVKPTMFDSVTYSIIYGQSTTMELAEFRQSIDESILLFAMRKISTEKLEELYHNVREMDMAIKLKDIEKAEELDWQYHNMLIQASENPFFIRITTSIYSIFRNSIGRNLSREEVNSAAAPGHLRMLDCIRDKDYLHIGNAVAESLSTWYEIAK